MRRTAGIVAFSIVIVSFLVGIAIGRMWGGVSAPSLRSDVNPTALTKPPGATMEAAPPSPEIVPVLMPGTPSDGAATPVPARSTPRSSPASGNPGGPATPGTSPIDYLKP